MLVADCCLLCVVRCSLGVARCFGVRCWSMLLACCLLFSCVVWCLLFGVCRVLFVVYCLLMGVGGWSLFAACCVLVGVRWL